MRKGVGISLAVVSSVAIVVIFILTSTGFILHNGTLYRVNEDLKRPLISTTCGATACDTMCLADDGSLQGLDLNNKCYSELFSKSE